VVVVAAVPVLARVLSTVVVWVPASCLSRCRHRMYTCCYVSAHDAHSCARCLRQGAGRAYGSPFEVWVKMYPCACSLLPHHRRVLDLATAVLALAVAAAQAGVWLMAAGRELPPHSLLQSGGHNSSSWQRTSSRNMPRQRPYAATHRQQPPTPIPSAPPHPQTATAIAPPPVQLPLASRLRCSCAGLDR
jgi:hypothetical protein